MPLPLLELRLHFFVNFHLKMYISQSGVRLFNWHTSLCSQSIWFPSAGPQSCQPASQWDAVDGDKLQQMTVERWRGAIVPHCWQRGIHHHMSSASHFTYISMCAWLCWPTNPNASDRKYLTETWSDFLTSIFNMFYLNTLVCTYFFTPLIVFNLLNVLFKSEVLFMANFL